MKPVEELINELDRLEKDLYALKHLNSQVYLDGATAAPSETAEGRGRAFEYISRMEYQTFATEAVGGLLRELVARKSELDEVRARRAEFLLRRYDETACIPQDEYIAYTVLLNDAEDVWHKAKANNDFASFAPYLEKIFGTLIRFTGYWDPEHKKAPYDVLLNQYEYGMSMEKLDPFFAALKTAIVPLVKQVAAAGLPRNDFLKREYPIEKQRELTRMLMDIETIDPKHCVCGETEHPFTLDFNKNDVRITTHYHLSDPMSSFYSVMHEGGHALYELHTGDELQYTVLANGCSMGIHESMSRFFENILGRSEAFVSFIFPKLRELFPEQLADVTETEFYHAVNRAEPSLIRTEADELTYYLHVMVRYEIEKGIIAGEIKIADLPQVWAAKYKEYLGIEVPDDTRGVLQDSHWSGGNIGYFPTYALGSAYGAQILKRMEQDIDVFGCAAAGDLKPVVDWLEEHIFRFGSLYDPNDLFEKVCGAPFDPQYFIDYLTKKFGA